MEDPDEISPLREERIALASRDTSDEDEFGQKRADIPQGRPFVT